MRTIIHIGQHKTGTSSIQHYMKQNKATLAKQGLYVPDQVVGFKCPSHLALNVYALGKNRSSPMKDNLLVSKSRFFFWFFERRLKADIARHYRQAINEGCQEIIWTNEGLYLLNSEAEYTKLIQLFSKYSQEIVVVCCFREIDSYRKSYIRQLEKHGVGFSQDKDSYRYVDRDSWLFDYEGKKKLLSKVFDNLVVFSYDPDDMVGKFMSVLGYSAENTKDFRRNVTQYT
ncbi:hypothetical protein KFU94_07305 [Chloroflexi bacterium TSY]|nr:hypothetical protein [Chloroflexi bacterium TSY]